MQRLKFAMAFNVGKSNAERLEAFAMYEKALGAVKVGEDIIPGENGIHIVAEIGGVQVLLAPGADVEKTVYNATNCEYHFDSGEELKKAYEILADGALSCSLEGPYPWAELLGLVVDKFGISWALYYNR